MKTFTTHTGLVLALDGSRVTITGEREKVLYDGDNKAEALLIYSYAVRHYVQRQIASEVDPEAEAEVPYVNG